MGKSKKNTETTQQTTTAAQSGDALTERLRQQLAQTGAYAAYQPVPGANGASTSALGTFGQAAGAVPSALNGLNVQQRMGMGGFNGLNVASQQGALGASGLNGVQSIGQTGNQTLANATASGQSGLDALGGDPTAVARFMNPYQQNVIGAMDTQNAQDSQRLTNSLASQATSAGAFGGSRYGVALGAAQAGLARDQSAQKANLLQSGYTDAMGRAGQVAQLGQQAGSQLSSQGANAAGQLYQGGLGASGQLASLGANASGTLGSLGMSGAQQQFAGGDYMRNVQQQQDPAQHALTTWQSVLGSMPTYTNTTASANGTSTQKKSGDLFGDLLGLGNMVSGFMPGGR